VKTGFAYAAVVLAALALSGAARTAPPFDLLITGGRIVDGTGNPWYAADLGIRDGRVAATGKLAGLPAPALAPSAALDNSGEHRPCTNE